jgi:hypothetical protein
MLAHGSVLPTPAPPVGAETMMPTLLFRHDLKAGDVGCLNAKPIAQNTRRDSRSGLPL